MEVALIYAYERVKAGAGPVRLSNKDGEMVLQRPHEKTLGECRHDLDALNKIYENSVKYGNIRVVNSADLHAIDRLREEDRKRVIEECAIVCEEYASEERGKTGESRTFTHHDYYRWGALACKEKIKALLSRKEDND